MNCLLCVQDEAIDKDRVHTFCLTALGVISTESGGQGSHIPPTTRDDTHVFTLVQSVFTFEIEILWENG